MAASREKLTDIGNSVEQSFSPLQPFPASGKVFCPQMSAEKMGVCKVHDGVDF